MKGSKVHPSDDSQNSATSADEQEDLSLNMNGTEVTSDKETKSSPREMEEKTSEDDVDEADTYPIEENASNDEDCTGSEIEEDKRSQSASINTEAEFKIDDVEDDETKETVFVEEVDLLIPPWDKDNFSDLERKKSNLATYIYLTQLAKSLPMQVIQTKEPILKLHNTLNKLEVEHVIGGLKNKQVESENHVRKHHASQLLHIPKFLRETYIVRHKLNNPKVTLNVGGERHEVMWTLLQKHHTTRLGRLTRAFTEEAILALADDYNLETNEYYWDRDSANFSAILSYYRAGKLHVTHEICIKDFLQDLKYWMVDERHLEPCCADRLNIRLESLHEDLLKEKRIYEKEVKELDEFPLDRWGRFQKQLWDLFEKPQSSRAATVASLISISLVLASLVGFCLNTLPSMQKVDSNGDSVENPVLATIETVCISYFTVEYILRFIGAPNKVAFLKNLMNVIDVLAIAPYWISLFFLDETPSVESVTDTSTLLEEEGEVINEEDSTFGSVSRIMQVFRIARIMRIFKLARRSVGLQSMAHMFRTSWKDIGLLFSLVLMGMLLFGSLGYYLENAEEDTGFSSIPQGMWWAVQTLTSVGYGDFTTQTVLGKFAGSFCAVCGVLVLALPIPIIVDNFAEYYESEKKIEFRTLNNEKNIRERIFKKRQAEALLEGLAKSIEKTRPGDEVAGLMNGDTHSIDFHGVTDLIEKNGSEKDC